MLSGLLNLTRYRNGIAYPYQLQINTKNLALAGDLIELFTSSLMKKRFELEDEIKLFYVEKVNPKVVQGLAKILFNRCEFSHYGDADPQGIRENVFTVSADYWFSSSQVTENIGEHKNRILKTAGISAINAYEETDTWLFGDISTNQILKSFDSIEAEKLLHRYNVEQIQGLLLQAETLTLKVFVTKDKAFRQVFQMLKFFQLMFDLSEADGNWLKFSIDGAGSVLDNSRSYGIELANFFPAILLLSVPWSLTATLRIPKRRNRFKLDLSDQDPLQTHYQEKSIWNNEKALALINRFNQKYAGQWIASAENQLIALPDNRFLIPDLSVKPFDVEKHVMVEWVHYLNESKIDLLRRLKSQIPDNYLFVMKGKKATLGALEKKLGCQVAVYTRELTAPFLLKAVKELI